MTLHYHQANIGTIGEFMDFAKDGRHILVSHARPANVERAHQYGQSVLLDNGAFSHWRLGLAPDWPAYYAWVDKWLDWPTTWAVIPDLIEGELDQQRELVEEWPFGNRGAPVWHLHEPLDYLLALLDAWPRVCMGSSKEYAVVLSPDWRRRMDEAWNAIAKRHRRTPWVHMLRGMQCLNQWPWPFASTDSADIARNYHRPQNGCPKEMASRWDQKQCPPTWKAREQLPFEDLLEA
jgi:hypothetical protein